MIVNHLRSLSVKLKKNKRCQFPSRAYELHSISPLARLEWRSTLAILPIA